MHIVCIVRWHGVRRKALDMAEVRLGVFSAIKTLLAVVTTPATMPCSFCHFRLWAVTTVHLSSQSDQTMSLL